MLKYEIVITDDLEFLIDLVDNYKIDATLPYESIEYCYNLHNKLNACIERK